MEIINVLKYLKIDDAKKVSDKEYTKELVDSDDFSVIYSLLDEWDDTILNTNLSTMNDSEVTLVYDLDDIQITIVGNLVEDTYALTVEKLNKKEGIQ